MINLTTGFLVGGNVFLRNIFLFYNSGASAIKINKAPTPIPKRVGIEIPVSGSGIGDDVVLEDDSDDVD